MPRTWVWGTRGKQIKTFRARILKGFRYFLYNCQRLYVHIYIGKFHLFFLFFECLPRRRDVCSLWCCNRRGKNKSYVATDRRPNISTHSTWTCQAVNEWNHILQSHSLALFMGFFLPTESAPLAWMRCVQAEQLEIFSI